MRISDIVAALLLATPAVDAQIPRMKGWSLTWADDFRVGRRNGICLPDPSNWIIDVGTAYPGGPPNWGTNEIQTYTDRLENVRVTGRGNLQITALRNQTGGWTSARIESRQSFVTPPGRKMRIQASLKIPGLGSRGIGYWAAFWTFGVEYRGNFQNWPSVGEIDIMENVNTMNQITGVMHCDKSPGGVCNEPSGLSANRNCPSYAPCPGNFYTYAIEIDRTRRDECIKWFVNGVQYHQVNQSQMPAAVWKQTIQKPHFILLNLAMGGAFPDAIYGSATPIASTVSGGTFEAEYVAVYHSRR